MPLRLLTRYVIFHASHAEVVTDRNAWRVIIIDGAHSNRFDALKTRQIDAIES
jgi:hypothetical protein